MHPLLDERLRFSRDFTTREVNMLTSVSPGVWISEMDDSMTPVLPHTDESDLFHLVVISEVEFPDSRPSVPQTPECRYPNTNSFLGLSLLLLFMWGLNLVKLSIDPTTIGCLDQDMMAQTCLSIASFLSFLNTNPRSRFFHEPWGYTAPIYSLLAKIKEKELRHLTPLFIPSI